MNWKLQAIWAVTFEGSSDPTQEVIGNSKSKSTTLFKPVDLISVPRCDCRNPVSLWRAPAAYKSLVLGRCSLVRPWRETRSVYHLHCHSSTLFDLPRAFRYRSSTLSQPYLDLPNDEFQKPEPEVGRHLLTLGFSYCPISGGGCPVASRGIARNL